MIRVLLALDDIETRAFYAANLETAGFRVIVARTHAVLATARRTGPQVIVTEASRAGDEERCAMLKREADLAGVPVIALAGPDLAGALHGACDLVLPVECLPDVLVHAIDRLVSRSRR
jgi:DNA-binding response OmpR family regulator